MAVTSYEHPGRVSRCRAPGIVSDMLVNVGLNGSLKGSAASCLELQRVESPFLGFASNPSAERTVIQLWW